MSVVHLKPKLYEARAFRAETGVGRFEASGTLCGHIDFIGPWRGSYPIRGLVG